MGGDTLYTWEHLRAWAAPVMLWTTFIMVAVFVMLCINTIVRRQWTEKERLALHAYYLQGRDVDEARSVLGLSRSGFYRVLSSAVGRLRLILNGQEVRR